MRQNRFRVNARRPYRQRLATLSAVPPSELRVTVDGSPKVPKAYSYVRMSTEAQLKGDSLRRQLEFSEKYAAEHDLELVRDFQLQDLGISAFKGKNATDGALGRFLAAIRNGAIPAGSYLLVESLDRISRQEPTAALSQFLEITNAGITVVTLADRQEYRTNAPLVDLLKSIIIMSRAHEESAIKSQRVSAAWANKRKNAKHQKLTARCPAWLELSSDRKSFTVIPERKAIIAHIFDEALAGIGAHSIAKRLNKRKEKAFLSPHGWHQSTIQKVLTSRAVIGEFQPFKKVDGRRISDGPPIADYFPQIIDSETFYAAQAGRASRRVGGGGRRGPYVSNLFSKVARCRWCHGPMRYENKGDYRRGSKTLVCDTAIRTGKCDATRWIYDDFEASFLAFVEEIDLGSLLNEDQSAKRRVAIDQAIASEAGKIDSLSIERENIFALMQQSGIDISFVAGKLRACEAALGQAQTAKAALEQQLQSSTSAIAAYYCGKDDLKRLIGEIGRRGDDSFKLRSKIAARLKAVISSLVIAPAADEGAHDRPGYLYGRYFAVKFKDGSKRVVFPLQSDPLSFRYQVLRPSQGEPDVLTSGGEHVPFWSSEKFLKSSVVAVI